MKTTNILKQMELKQEQSKILNAISDKREKDLLASDLYNNYIKPRIKERNISLDDFDLYSTMKRHNGNYSNYIRRKQDSSLFMKFLNKMVNKLSKGQPINLPYGENAIDDIDDDTNIENDTDIDLLEFNNNLDEEDKIFLADSICDYLYKTTNFDKKCDEYFNKYVLPLLEEKNKKEEIIFDTNSTNENIKTITNNTLKFIKYLIEERASLSLYDTFVKDTEDKDTIDRLNFIYTDNETIQSNLAKSLIELFVSKYNKLDLSTNDNLESNVNILYK